MAVTDVATDLINVGTISSEYFYTAGATETVSNGVTSWSVTEGHKEYSPTSDTEVRFQTDTSDPTSVELATFSPRSGVFSSNTALQVVAYDGTNVLLGLPNGSGGYAQYYVVSDSSTLDTSPITDMSTTGPYTPPPPVCFVEGTRIRTARGDVAVETLTEGDSVAVHTRNGVTERPVVWVGRRRVNAAAHSDPERVLPIRIRRDAFAAGQPSRDLLVSPDHAIYLDGLLIPAKLLVNGGSIVQDTERSRVVYYHVELSEHSVIYAEDLPAESYLDTGNRVVFENGGALMMLHPDFSISARLQLREEGSCAPFVVAPTMVRPIWHKLAQRSGRIGYPVLEPETISDPDLRLCTAARQLRPLSVTNDTYLFALPPGTDDVRLVSRAARPNQTRPWIEDSRCLGVRIGRITVKDGCDLAEVAIDGPALGSGWWAVETDGAAMARWTNGEAHLVLPPGNDTVRLLELKLAGSTPYPVAHEPEASLPALKAA
jgi:hypothetical protein